MRARKYRIFEPVNRIMHDVDIAFITKDGNFILPVKFQNTVDNHTVMNLDAVHIMEYTGCHDKYLREICEGDIVEYPYTEGIYCEQNMVINCEVVYGNGSFRLISRAFEQMYLLENRPSSLTVIGNIYETPGLLK